MRERFPDAPLAAARGDADVRLGDGERVRPAVGARARPATRPTTSPSSSAASRFTGDAVLGEGSVFVCPDPGALAGYLDGARSACASASSRVLVPRPRAAGRATRRPSSTSTSRTASSASGRLRRGARRTGRRARATSCSTPVWDDAPAALRPAAAVTLAAHLDKLRRRGAAAGGRRARRRAARAG